jgi:hypothetical protein
MKFSKFVITKFVPKEQEEETVASGAISGEPHEHKIKLAPEPSYFEGKTMATECSGVLFDSKELKDVLDEEVLKPESRKGMVGWTIPSFHKAIDSINIPQHTKNMIKSRCTALLHKHGLKVDVADYHDRIYKRLGIDDK